MHDLYVEVVSHFEKNPHAYRVRSKTWSGAGRQPIFAGIYFMFEQAKIKLYTSFKNDLYVAVVLQFETIPHVAGTGRWRTIAIVNG